MEWGTMPRRLSRESSEERGSDVVEIEAGARAPDGCCKVDIWN
jgi:hypothetical protein